jgi:hypothetical protein
MTKSAVLSLSQLDKWERFRTLMSQGAGRLERAVIEVMCTAVAEGKSIENICRRVYPQAATVEKKHRVAVLQVLNRLKDNPPRPLEDRSWTVEPTGQRGYWRRIFIEGFQSSDSRTHIAFHEAGHALAELYFGRSIERIVVHTRDQIFKQRRNAAKHAEGTRYTVGHVLLQDHWAIQSE